MTVLKAVVGLCLGIALLMGLQSVMAYTLQESIRSNVNAGLPVSNTPVVTGFKLGAEALKGMLPKYGAIDTSEGQRLAIEGAARRVDLQNRNALSHVPLPRR